MTVKPYVFNNYEQTLPLKERGYYKSDVIDQLVSKKVTEQIEGIQLTVDLSGVRDKEEVHDRFYSKMGFPNREDKSSWDALGDFLWFFPESSGAFLEINPKIVHIRVVNINHIWKFSEKDYSILCEILTTSTDNSRFDDGFRVIVEVLNN